MKKTTTSATPFSQPRVNHLRQAAPLHGSPVGLLDTRDEIKQRRLARSIRSHLVYLDDVFIVFRTINSVKNVHPDGGSHETHTGTRKTPDDPLLSSTDSCNHSSEKRGKGKRLLFTAAPSSRDNGRKMTVIDLHAGVVGNRQLDTRYAAQVKSTGPAHLLPDDPAREDENHQESPDPNHHDHSHHDMPASPCTVAKN